MFYGWLEAEGRLPGPSPVRRLQPIRIPPGVPRPADDDVIAAALAAADARTLLMLRLAAELGLRRGEVAAADTRLLELAGLRVRGKGRIPPRVGGSPFPVRGPLAYCWPDFAIRVNGTEAHRAHEAGGDHGRYRAGGRVRLEHLPGQARLTVPRKLAFWVAVGGASIIANFAVELAARKIPQPGLARFVEFLHNGPGNGREGTV